MATWFDPEELADEENLAERDLSSVNETSGGSSLELLDLLNPFKLIAAVLKWFVSTLMNIVDIVKMTFTLVGKVLALVLRNWHIKLGIVFGVGFVFLMVDDIFGASGMETLSMWTTIAGGAFALKFLLYDVPNILWGEALKSTISDEKIVLYSSCLFAGIIATGLPMFVFSSGYGFHIYYWGCVAYGIYTGSFYKILKRM